jgi:hypothetical protein
MCCACCLSGALVIILVFVSDTWKRRKHVIYMSTERLVYMLVAVKWETALWESVAMTNTLYLSKLSCTRSSGPSSSWHKFSCRREKFQVAESAERERESEAMREVAGGRRLNSPWWSSHKLPVAQRMFYSRARQAGINFSGCHSMAVGQIVANLLANQSYGGAFSRLLIFPSLPALPIYE